MALYSLAPDEAQANYYRLRVNYFAKLKQKLDKGDITQTYYDAEQARFSQELQDPNNLLAQAGDFDYAKFAYDVEQKAGQFVGAGLKAVGQGVGTTIGAGAGGFFSGLGIMGTIVVLGLVAGAIWFYLPKKG